MVEIKTLEETGNATVHRTAELEPGVIFGKNLRVWRWSHVSAGAQIGDNVMIGEHVHIGPNVIIGNNCRIQNGVNIFDGVVLEDDVFVGPMVCFTNIRKPKAAVPNKNYMKTVVKKGASLGAGTIVVCGVIIGEGSLSGAGTVIIKDVPPHVTVVGNPQRCVRAKLSML